MAALIVIILTSACCCAVVWKRETGDGYSSGQSAPVNPQPLQNRPATAPAPVAVRDTEFMRDWMARARGGGLGAEGIADVSAERAAGRVSVNALYGPSVRINPLTYGNAMMLCNWTFLNFPDVSQVQVRAFNGTLLSSGFNGSCRRTDQGLF